MLFIKYYRLLKHYRMVKGTPLFNEEFYLKEYPDVAAAGMHPIKHYLKFGEKEGRWPSEAFDPEFYLKENPDVKAAGFSPLIHYIQYGCAEGRKCIPECSKLRISSVIPSILPATLIIDHNGGGGTWKYLYDNILAPKKNSENSTSVDKIFILARYDWAKRQVVIQCFQNWEILGTSLVKREQVFYDEIEAMNLEEIIVNSVVNWPVENILSCITKYKRKNHLTRVQYKGHDFFCVCPSYTLLDSSNLHCGVRCDEFECHECLKQCEAGRVALTPTELEEFSISRWRKMWSSFFLRTVDRFEVFSESSKAFFLKAYPRLEPIIKFVPHKISSFNICQVAVVGNLTVHKGLNVVKDLCDFLDMFCIDNMMIHSFGGCGNIFSKHLVDHGAYDRNSLPELLKKEKIDIIFIPSIWHETFCYTMGESLAMGYPTACFDIGGQAEQAKKSDLGIILYDKKPSYIYQTLMDVYSANLSTESASAKEQVTAAEIPEKCGAAAKVIVQDRSSRDFLNWMYQQRTDKTHFVPEATDYIKRTDEMPQIIAAYLPQFHDFPENIRWFGKGFTEWTNTSQTLPQFIGHHQPHVPIDVGYYNLNNTDIMHRQAELAKKYGVTGFCVYYYWFSGTKLMDAPLKRILEDKDLDFPFFLFWANDDWTRNWGDGAAREVLYHSQMKPEEAELFMADILPYMKDPRYIKIDNKPVLLLYKVHLFPLEDYLQFVENIQTIARQNGFEGLYLLAPIEDYMDHENLEAVQAKYHLDALMEFHPIAGRKGWNQKKENFVDPACRSTCYDVEDFILNRKYLLDTKAKVLPGLFPSWDNSPRRFNRGAWVLQNTPENYKKWLADLIQWTNKNRTANERIIFVNAWNEWAECAHLEPDTYHGYAYLQKTREALEESINSQGDK